MWKLNESKLLTVNLTSSLTVCVCISLQRYSNPFYGGSNAELSCCMKAVPTEALSNRKSSHKQACLGCQKRTTSWKRFIICINWSLIQVYHMKTLLSHSLKTSRDYYRCVKRTERRKIRTEQPTWRPLSQPRSRCWVVHFLDTGPSCPLTLEQSVKHIYKERQQGTIILNHVLSWEMRSSLGSATY